VASIVCSEYYTWPSRRNYLKPYKLLKLLD